MVSYVAGEEWTDHPECACPILTLYAIKLNDNFDRKQRQKLKPIIPLLVDTQSDDALRIKRKKFFMFRNVTATYPLLLDLVKLPDLAEKLRSFKNNAESMTLAAIFLNENKGSILKAADACADAYVYVYADAYAYADADADVYVYTDVYADVYVYADADADGAYREKVADVCIETLRMACEIT
ncbi:unnamed protein product [Sphagnum balticum]